MPAPLLSKNEVVNRLVAVFRRHGFDGASLQLLSEATGLGRSSLYHYFPGGKEGMAAAALESVLVEFEASVIGELRKPAEPEIRIKRAGRKLLKFYDQGNNSCLLEIFAMGGAKQSHGDIVSAAFFAMCKEFAKVAIDAGLAKTEAARRAEDAVIAIQGALVFSRGTNSSASFKRVVRELPEKLLAAP